MKDEVRLLEDLSRLVERYGPERFASLAALLRDPEQAQNLAAILERTSSTQPPLSRKHRPQLSQSPPGSRILEAIRASDPKKYELLSSFRDDFAAHRVLPTFRHIRGLADQTGIPLRVVNSRDKAITPLLRFLSRLPVDDVENVLHRIASEEGGDRGLAVWSDVIRRRGSHPLP